MRGFLVSRGIRFVGDDRGKRQFLAVQIAAQYLARALRNKVAYRSDEWEFQIPREPRVEIESRRVYKQHHFAQRQTQCDRKIVKVVTSG